MQYFGVNEEPDKDILEIARRMIAADTVKNTSTFRDNLKKYLEYLINENKSPFEKSDESGKHFKQPYQETKYCWYAGQHDDKGRRHGRLIEYHIGN
jgi:hypothetical protein